MSVVWCGVSMVWCECGESVVWCECGVSVVWCECGVSVVWCECECGVVGGCGVVWVRVCTAQLNMHPTHTFVKHLWCGVGVVGVVWCGYGCVQHN